MNEGDCALCNCRTLDGRRWPCYGCGGEHAVCFMCAYQHCEWVSNPSPPGTQICPAALRVAREMMGESA